MVLDEPRVTRRQAQAEARREQLLEVALDLFAEKGVRGTTIRDIAQAAGVADGLVCHYFGNKPALVRAVIEHYEFRQEIDQLIPQVRSLPAEEAFRVLGEAYLRLLEGNRRYVTMVISESLRDPEVAQVFGRILSDGLGILRRMIDERVAAGEMRPHEAELTFRTLQGSIVWFFLMNRRLDPALPAMDPQRFIDGVTEIVFNGLGRDSRCAMGQGARAMLLI
jgi:AcrR family transcriptional regulator